jgi:hypothetical protein
MQRTSVVNDSVHIRQMRPWLTPRAGSILWNLLAVAAAGLGAVFTVLSLMKGTIR